MRITKLDKIEVKGSVYVIGTYLYKKRRYYWLYLVNKSGKLQRVTELEEGYKFVNSSQVILYHVVDDLTQVYKLRNDKDLINMLSFRHMVPFTDLAIGSGMLLVFYKTKFIVNHLTEVFITEMLKPTTVIHGIWLPSVVMIKQQLCVIAINKKGYVCSYPQVDISPLHKVDMSGVIPTIRRFLGEGMLLEDYFDFIKKGYR